MKKESFMRFDTLIVLLTICFIFWQGVEERSSLEASVITLPVKVLTMDMAFEKSSAGTMLNDIREAMGMNTLLPHLALESASQSHADYLLANHSASHEEQEGKPYFMGTKPVDRAIRAGYASRTVSENISTQVKDAKASINGLFSAIYHRFGFLSTFIDEIGIGVAQNPKNPKESAFVYVMGNSEMARVCSEDSFIGEGKYFYRVCKDKAQRIVEKEFQKAKTYHQMNNPPIILYPYDGQSEVPPAFYAEIPDPLPDYDVSGFPVSISFNSYFFTKIELRSFVLYDSEDSVVEVIFMDKESDPHGRFSARDFALFPLERLDFDREYRAEVVYEHKGIESELSWYFHTEIPQEKLYIISEKKQKISLAKGQSYLLYFKPSDPRDILSEIYFPSTLTIERLDNNTLKISLPKAMRDFEIVSGERVLKVEVF
jgi:hypothetical protein